jgi:hypothetical protein
VLSSARPVLFCYAFALTVLECQEFTFLSAIRTAGRAHKKASNQFVLSGDYSSFVTCVTLTCKGKLK